MKRIIVLLILVLSISDLYASHIVGGEVFYTYLGPGTRTNSSRYRVSLRLFRDCNVTCGQGSVACLPAVAIVSIYTNASPYTRAVALNVPLQSSNSISLSTYPACISARPSVCYEIKTYSAETTLDNNSEGYVLAYQNCCRAQATNVIDNAPSINGSPGVTYDCIMPGRNILPSGVNSSAVFNVKDTALVCYQSGFTLDFGATDPDGDSLSFDLAPAYQSNPAFEASNDQLPAFPPPYPPVTYNFDGGFNGFEPLGPDVTINPTTGLISGISPARAGRYVVNVIVNEWRNQVLIGRHRKDFIMRVENCNVPAAILDPSYITCDGFDLSFKNNSTSPIINSYYWDFGVENMLADTSNSPTPTYVFSDSGTYTVTLITNRGQQCSDTATTTAKVYPGFVPDFEVDGSCILNPYQFTDRTTSKYGQVDSWRWDFGDASSFEDISSFQNPAYKYNSVQTATVSLIVTNTKGCLDTVSKQVAVLDKPIVEMAFKDTLICIIDTLQLNAKSGNGVIYSWAPNPTLSDTDIPDPLVYPKDTTVYSLTINDNGCIATDNVTVNVIPFVTLDLIPDTTICLTDQLQMFPTTNALYFSWSPATGISDVTVKNPLLQPLTKTTYSVFASVGKCNATDNITIDVVPYPQVYAGADTSVCYGTTASLLATTDAPFYTWAPASSLTRATTLSPTAAPVNSTPYTLTVRDTLGCPKPVTDTVVVTVIPPVPAFAGRDTTIVITQPLQLNATGGAFYAWSPATGMNDPGIANPVVTLGPQYDSVTYQVRVTTPEGCSATDDIKVIVFKTAPDIIVPSAFTPNADGFNDIMRPKPVGMKQLTYFRIYNRLGQLLYSTSTEGQGWDGRLKGIPQPSGAYVYMAQGIDYTGKTINKKGTLVLVR